MHEWALAEAVVSSAAKFSREKGVRTKEIVVAIGELQQIDMEVFEFAMKEVMKAMGEDFRVEFRKQKAVFKCKVCRSEWAYEPEKMGEQERECIHFIPEVIHDYSKCPSCGSRDFAILKGRGVWLNSIKGE